MLYGVKVKSEQVSLDCIAKDGEWLGCPDIGQEFVSTTEAPGSHKLTLTRVGTVSTHSQSELRFWSPSLPLVDYVEHL